MPEREQQVCGFLNFTQQAYRYGIALSCIGFLLNWLGVAQTYIEPVRYFGVAMVILGSFLIISAMCRWTFLSTPNTTDVNTSSSNELHVITVPMGRLQGRYVPHSPTPSYSKPPDYCMVADKPPTYEEAIAMLPVYQPTAYSSSSELSQETGSWEFLPHQVPEPAPTHNTGAETHEDSPNSSPVRDVGSEANPSISSASLDALPAPEQSKPCVSSVPESMSSMACTSTMPDTQVPSISSESSKGHQASGEQSS